MATPLNFFDMSVSVTSPKGHLEPLVLTLGPNWQPNDIRLFFVSASAVDPSGGNYTVEIEMNPDPPTGFTAAYSRIPGFDTHGVYYRRLVAGDNDRFASWTKPTDWRHFMVSMLTVRGVSPTSNPTAGTLSGVSGQISYVPADTTNSATVSSITVPGAGTMVYFIGNVACPSQTPWPNWPIAMGVPTDWTPLVATPNSGNTFYPYDTQQCVNVVAKTFNASGSTGSVEFPTAQGSPAFAGLYCFLTPAADVSVNVGAA